MFFFNSLENGEQFLDSCYQIIAPFFNASHSLDLVVEAIMERNQGGYSTLIASTRSSVVPITA